MRRRAVSRPVGSYHSWRVWMPPPVPPAPMAMAGTAAGEGDVGVGGAEAGFGAEGEMAVDGAEGVEEGGVVGEGGGGAVSDGFDVEFWWWGCGFLCGGVVTISSKIWWTAVAVETSWVGSVERMSRSAVADSGMELMEVPPEMWPTLMVVRGSAGSSRSAMLR